MTRYVLAIDPGKMTGMAFFSMESGGEPVLISSGEYSQDDYAKPIRDTLALYPTTEIVCEKFTITMETAKKSEAPYSLEQIGVLKQIMRDVGRNADKLPLQQPADAKKMFPNPALKKLAYWHRGGAGHAMDAIRHGLLYLAKSGWMPKNLI